MKHALKLLISFFILISCATTPISPTPIIIHSATSAIPATPVPVLAVKTATHGISCDARSEDYCLTDGHFIFQRPIKPPANESVDSTYPYGSTVRETREPHHGVEFLNKFGTPVYAAADGLIIFAGSDTDAIYSPWINFYGNLIVIEHANALFTLYAHLSKIDLQVGEDVHAGDKIGEVGQSGVATGSHLHFEVRRGDAADYFSTLNPELWLVPNRDKNREPFGALMISVVDGDGRFRFTEMTVKYYPDRSEPQVKSHYVVTYSSDLAIGEENATLGDLPRGSYRIAFKTDGQIYERWVEVESGKLTQVVFIVE
jgi:hypothetical protein